MSWKYYCCLYKHHRATHSLWPDTVRQYYCVDDAPEMNKMAMQILKGNYMYMFICVGKS